MNGALGITDGTLPLAPHASMLRVGTEFVAGVLLLRAHQQRPPWLGRLVEVPGRRLLRAR